MAELTAEPHRRRTDLAKRVDLARELLRPYAAASGSVEARLARRAWLALADIAAELVDDDD